LSFGAFLAVAINLTHTAWAKKKIAKNWKLARLGKI
jgi:hypothetical protein